MSAIADQINAAATTINTAVAALTANGIVDPTIPPAVANLDTAVASLTALSAPPAAPAVSGS